VVEGVLIWHQRHLITVETRLILVWARKSHRIDLVVLIVEHQIMRQGEHLHVMLDPVWESGGHRINPMPTQTTHHQFPTTSFLREPLYSCWPALLGLSWHSKQSNTLVSLQEHIPLISRLVLDPK
jgi:hypothetical protein